MFDKDKQKLLINSTNLRIFKLTFRNIYKFLKINWVNESISPTTMIFFLCSFIAKKKFF